MDRTAPDLRGPLRRRGVRFACALALASAGAVMGCSGGSGDAGVGSAGSASTGGSAAASPSPVSPSPAPSPGTPASTAVFVVAWTPVQGAGITGYRVYFSDGPLDRGVSLRHLDVAGATVAQGELVPSAVGIATGATLYVAVASRDAAGNESPLSSTAQAVVR